MITEDSEESKSSFNSKKRSNKSLQDIKAIDDKTAKKDIKIIFSHIKNDLVKSYERHRSQQSPVEKGKKKRNSVIFDAFKQEFKN